jgi:predicted O-linked N-acetylglucosamine transferase (SPINDLY family)
MHPKITTSIAAPPPVEKGRKVKVGFVSNYFREHSVCKLFCEMIKGMDRDGFETHVFSGSTRSDSCVRGERALSRSSLRSLSSCAGTPRG